MTGKEYDYIIILKRPDYKLPDLISLFLCLITLIPFIYFLTAGADKRATYFITIIVIALQLSINFFRRKNGQFINHKYAFSVCFIAWLVIPVHNYLLAILYFIALIMETQVKFPQEIGLNDDGVIFNSFPKKFFHWNDFVNILLKENMLTLDFKNNKLLQKETEEEVNPQIEKEFNSFCSKKISMAVA